MIKFSGKISITAARLPLGMHEKITSIPLRLTSCKETIFGSSKLEKENIWIYILDLKPDQMIEYGEVLPKSGQEKKWFNKLDKSLQKKLQKIETV